MYPNAHLTIQIMSPSLPTWLSRYCLPVFSPIQVLLACMTIAYLTIQVLLACFPIAHLTIQVCLPVCPPDYPGTPHLYAHLTIQVLPACMPTWLSRYCPPVCPPDYPDNARLYVHLTIQVLPACMPTWLSRYCPPVCPPDSPDTARLYAKQNIQKLPACMPTWLSRYCPPVLYIPPTYPGTARLYVQLNIQIIAPPVRSPHNPDTVLPVCRSSPLCTDTAHLWAHVCVKVLPTCRPASQSRYWALLRTLRPAASEGGRPSPLLPHHVYIPHN